MQKQTSPRTEIPAIAGFLLGDYRRDTCPSRTASERRERSITGHS